MYASSNTNCKHQTKNCPMGLAIRLSASYNDNNHVSDHFLRIKICVFICNDRRVGDEMENQRRNTKITDEISEK